MSVGSDIELHVFEELCQHAVPAVTLGIDVLGSWDEKPWRLHQSLSMSRYANRSQPHVTDLWCAASGSWPIPPLMQCRLIDEHLSHTVGPVEPDEDGPADLDPQDLEVLFEEEDDLSFLLASFPHEDDPLITLDMYGLYITHHSIRSATTSGDIASIKETILRTWSDILPRHSLMNAFLLKPQDLIGVSIIQFLVEIVPPEIRIPAIDVPILRRTKWYSDDSTSIETAYMRDSQTGYELLIDAGHEGWCFPPRNIQCNLHIEGRIAFLSLRHPLRQGAVLSFFIHDDWVDPGVSADSHATSDETSLVGFPRWISSPVFVVSEGGSVTSGIGGLKANSASGTSVPPTCSHETDKSPLLGTSVQDVVPTCQFRPNPDIRIPFDEDLPIVRHTEQGPIVIGRTIPPPNWSQSTLYRAASAAGSVSRTTHGQLFVRVRTWVVEHVDGGRYAPRDFTMRAQLLVRLREKIKRVWQDVIGPNDHLGINVVRPAPFADADGTRYLPILAEANRPGRCTLQPVLFAVREIAARGVMSPTWCACLVPSVFSVADVYEACQPAGELHQLLVPQGSHEQRWMGPRHTRTATVGLFVPVWWDARLQPEEGHDDLSLMQRGGGRECSRSPRRAEDTTPFSTQSSSTQLLAHVFRLSREHRVLSLDRASFSNTFGASQIVLGCTSASWLHRLAHCQLATG